MFEKIWTKRTWEWVGIGMEIFYIRKEGVNLVVFTIWIELSVTKRVKDYQNRVGTPVSLLTEIKEKLNYKTLDF